MKTATAIAATSVKMVVTMAGFWNRVVLVVRSDFFLGCMAFVNVFMIFSPSELV
jgi:hypothetical protein